MFKAFVPIILNDDEVCCDVPKLGAFKTFYF